MTWIEIEMCIYVLFGELTTMTFSFIEKAIDNCKISLLSSTVKMAAVVSRILELAVRLQPAGFLDCLQLDSSKYWVHQAQQNNVHISRCFIIIATEKVTSLNKSSEFCFSLKFNTSRTVK